MNYANIVHFARHQRLPPGARLRLHAAYGKIRAGLIAMLASPYGRVAPILPHGLFLAIRS